MQDVCRQCVSARVGQGHFCKSQLSMKFAKMGKAMTLAKPALKFSHTMQILNHYHYSHFFRK